MGPVLGSAASISALHCFSGPMHCEGRCGAG
jgi:hypothetical protein